MCQLVVMVVDREAEDPYVDAKAYKRGDVITIQDDEWKWGKDELSHPDWKIVSVPGVPAVDLISLLSAEPETDPQNPSRMLQRRLYSIDVDALPEIVRIKKSSKPDPNIL